jgi:hypothetical protein
MTKRDFVLIAESFAKCAPDAKTAPAAREMWRDLRGTIATALDSTNPRFDRDRFLRACANGKEI